MELKIKNDELLFIEMLTAVMTAKYYGSKLVILSIRRICTDRLDKYDEQLR